MYLDYTRSGFDIRKFCFHSILYTILLEHVLKNWRLCDYSTLPKQTRNSAIAKRSRVSCTHTVTTVPLLRQLRQRIVFKMAVLIRKAHTTGTPTYLSQHLHQRTATYSTRSSSLPLLTVPNPSTVFARRAFNCTDNMEQSSCRHFNLGPRIWF